jgi:hypothetical protein
MAASPDALPVLSRGKHKHPSKGACFLEYTALLAGEPFSDAPACVDRQLAAVLRHANDLLSDADRPRLVPLLGRAVGLVIRPPSAADGWPAPDPVDGTVGSFARTTVALHRRVASRFLAAIAVVPTQAELREYDNGRDLDRFFWFLMQRPSAVSSSGAYVGRLVDRLQVLHACFEEELRFLGLSCAAAEQALGQPGRGTVTSSPDSGAMPEPRHRCGPADRRRRRRPDDAPLDRPVGVGRAR